MSEMIQRVAKAIADAGRDSQARARAAIEAMREPTREMVLAARNTFYDPDAWIFDESRKRDPDRHVLQMAENDYKAMIDAALN